jgi:hypothetical protein
VDCFTIFPDFCGPRIIMALKIFSEKEFSYWRLAGVTKSN